MIHNIQITIYRAYIDEEFVFIAKSEEEALERAKDSYWYDESPNGNLRIITEEKTVQVIKGELNNWSDNDKNPNYHVHWKCPKCNKEHQTDTSQVSPQSALWFCEVGTVEDIFYVKW